MGRSTNTEARRAQIADALIGLLAHGSFTDTSVAAVARAAGLAVGLVHHHFSCKEEVLALAVERLTIQLEVRLETRCRNAGSGPCARVNAFIDAWLALDAQSDVGAVLAWVAIGDEARHSAVVRELYLAALARSQARLTSELVLVLPRANRRRAAAIAEQVLVAIEGALRVGAAGGLTPGSAAPMVRAVCRGLLASPRTPPARSRASARAEAPPQHQRRSLAGQRARGPTTTA